MTAQVLRNQSSVLAAARVTRLSVSPTRQTSPLWNCPPRNSMCPVEVCLRDNGIDKRCLLFEDDSSSSKCLRLCSGRTNNAKKGFQQTISYQAYGRFWFYEDGTWAYATIPLFHRRRSLSRLNTLTELSRAAHLHENTKARQTDSAIRHVNNANTTRMERVSWLLSADSASDAPDSMSAQLLDYPDCAPVPRLPASLMD